MNPTSSPPPIPPPTAVHPYDLSCFVGRVAIDKLSWSNGRTVKGIVSHDPSLLTVDYDQFLADRFGDGEN